MTVFELVGTSAWNDWADRRVDHRIGLFSTEDKARAKIKEIKEIKKNKEWKMSWDSFRVLEVEVK